MQNMAACKAFVVYFPFRSKIKYFVAVNLNTSRCNSSLQVADNTQNHTPVPEYPEIVDPSKEGQRLRERQAWYRKIEKMPTVDEKLLEITSQGRHRPYLLHTPSAVHGTLPFYQYATRTHLIHGLPDVYHSMTVDDWVEKLRQPLLDSVLIEMDLRGKNSLETPHARIQEQKRSHRIIKNIASVIMSAGITEHEHLISVQMQELPRCDYYWWHGKFYQKKDPEFGNACFQSTWEPSFQILSDKPLPMYLERDDPLCATSEVPECPWNPSVWQCSYEQKYVMCVPGYWSGAKKEYPLLAFDTRFKLFRYKSQNFDEGYIEKIIDGMGVLGMFGMLGAVAAYQGFTQFHELTYPLTSQLVVTDGRLWSFFTYQLNTICFHQDVDTNSHRNICWSSGPMELFKSVEDGKLQGVNDDVLRMLLKFMFRVPAKREGVEMKPYLGEDLREEEAILETRKLLRWHYDNRMDHRLIRAETPTWHWVYKRNPLAPHSPTVRLW